MNKVLDSIAEQIAETLEELRSLAKSKKLIERIDYLADRLEALCGEYEELLREKAGRVDRAHRAGQAQQPQSEVRHRPAALRAGNPLHPIDIYT